MRDLTREALLDDVRRWMAIESPTLDIGAVTRTADHAEAELSGLEASIVRIAGTGYLADILLGRVPGQREGPRILVLAHMGAVHPVGRRASPLPFWVRGERVAGVGSDRNVTGALELPTLDRLGMIGEGPHTHENNLLIPCLIPRTTLWVRPFAKPMAADQAPGSSAAM